MDPLSQLLILAQTVTPVPTPIPVGPVTTLPPDLQFFGWSWTAFSWGTAEGVAAAAWIQIKMARRGLRARFWWLHAVVLLILPLFAGLVTAGALFPPNQLAALMNGASILALASALVGKDLTDW